jgi:hypothetical protein
LAITTVLHDPANLWLTNSHKILYVGNTNGNLNLIAFGSGVSTPTAFNPQFTDASGTTAGSTATGSYTLIGPLCYFRVYVDFSTTTNFGTLGYQITLPFASVETMRIAGGTLHQLSGSGAPALFHIAGITDVTVSTTVHKLYYSVAAPQTCPGNSTLLYPGPNQTVTLISQVSTK